VRSDALSTCFVLVVLNLPAKSRGELVSVALTGSWRKSQPSTFNLTQAELDDVVPLLYGSGAGALGWWRVRATELSETDSAQILHQAYRLQSLQSVIHEEKICRVFRLFGAHSIEAILLKGWAAAGLYPDRSLRPYGDIDLVVRPEQHQLARELLARPDVKDCWVDLHEGIDELEDRPGEALFDRAAQSAINDQVVKVLSAEDQLALLSIHLLKHGAWRPLWLCDISAAIEDLPTDFDWNVCLGQNRTRRGWITAAIRLANLLLSANIESVPEEVGAAELPDWLTRSVLRQWQEPFAINQPPMSHSRSMASALRHPATLLEALRQRWPNPILATVSINGSINSLPRFPYQIGNCLTRAGRFLSRAPRTAP
jgi:hypothetical protein